MHRRPLQVLKIILFKMENMPQEKEEEVECSTEDQMAT